MHKKTPGFVPKDHKLTKKIRYFREKNRSSPGQKLIFPTLIIVGFMLKLSIHIYCRRKEHSSATTITFLVKAKLLKDRFTYDELYSFTINFLLERQPKRTIIS